MTAATPRPGGLDAALPDNGARLFGYRLVVAARLFDRRIMPILKRLGLNLSQWRVLGQLGHAGPSTVRELAEGSAVDRADASRSLRNLEQRGLVTRAEDERDQRSPIFSLTRDGERLYDEARESLGTFTSGLFGSLSPADIEATNRVLRAIAVATARPSPAAEPGAENTA